ncbi:MAG: electron transporter [Pleurocapsa sp. MO_192.B19]|nr:electron transporter [Pleurocapsa sp. MO_192.B19]
MFAPIVVLVRTCLGQAKFNQLRGKGIALHSQVITAVCNRFGIERTTRQNLIRTARDNGKKLGFLA